MHEISLRTNMKEHFLFVEYLNFQIICILKKMYHIIYEYHKIQLVNLKKKDFKYSSILGRSIKGFLKIVTRLENYIVRFPAKNIAYFFTILNCLLDSAHGGQRLLEKLLFVKRQVCHIVLQLDKN